MVAATLARRLPREPEQPVVAAVEPGEVLVLVEEEEEEP